ncbi:DMSO/TMAO reductase YedYZ molybdopterin-dependent catalytic subunit [Saccharomonospora amisosensis]|uniref:DMSO/TMAO reductase YedYZ molybdopterin-dependent catalytic subunit n=1 Tax=Saccharomonospora amisosensis TaxID=1128677 RepID=A0A7X5UUY9_9PSEU|nr:molybdopterin-dependent oxidoreductase [Saccharomonospora amisosensis]NIJ14747.1 DMSO/TMAO reductase YedYZ molybdopterin-dependent catalytic subunit [Saccharomonospora amisosensis]
MSDVTGARRPPRISGPVSGLIGLLALAAALAAGHLMAAFVGIGASPYFAVGSAAIDLAPTWLKDWAVGTFGSYDKLVLLAGMAAVLMSLAVTAGLLSRRRPLAATIVIAGLGVLAGVAVLTRPDVGRLALLAPLAAVAAGLGVFHWLHALARRGRHDPGERPFEHAEQVTTDRRRFLAAAGGVAAGAGLAGLGGVLIGGGKDAAGSRAAVGELAVARPAPPVPAGADFAGSGTPSFLTSNDSFYRIDTALVVPQVRAQDWTLRVHGMVERELTIDYADIRARPLVERTVTLCCVSNEVGGPYVSTANFIGIDLADLLAEAGVEPGAEQLFSTSADGWTCGTPVEAVTDGSRGAMLAIGMNGEPLPLEHGFPARMVVPGLYGYVSATKWVTDLELTTWQARRAYWLERGWAQRAPVKTQSRVDFPAASATVPTGTITVAGTAWAQSRGIAKVEVRLDEGPWRTAELSADVSDDAWRMWRIELELPRPGEYSVACRATDKSGYTQTGERAPVLPDGATGRHTVRFTAR